MRLKSSRLPQAHWQSQHRLTLGADSRRQGCTAKDQRYQAQLSALLWDLEQSHCLSQHLECHSSTYADS